MLRTRNLPAYRDLLMLFTKYGRKDFRVNLDRDEILSPAPPDAESEIEPEVKERAAAFAKALKDLGPTYVKFGQLLSTRPDIVPPEYIAELEQLQDSVEPFSFADVEKTIEDELGVRISKAFQSFDSTPLAAASLGQAHQAVLRDGREVVVKVQRPNVREQVRHDLEVFAEIAETIEEHSDVGKKMNLVATIEQVRLTLTNELNYLQEARNTDMLRHNLEQFPLICVPAVIHDFSSSRVLTTELVRGRKVSKLTPLMIIDRDYAELASILTRAYLKQICVDGFWHSDPHPGNVFLRDDELVLIDFGMVSRVTQEMQDEIIKLLLALSSNNGVEVAEACVRMSQVLERFDITKFHREISTLVSAFHDADTKSLNTGQVLFRIIALANENELIVPAELAMLAKTLLNLDGITRKLDPNYDPQRVIREYSQELMAQKLKQKFEPQNFYPALLDLNQLILDLPHRSREILDLTAGGKLTFGIKLTQAEEFLAGIHKIANRITVGLVIAALLVASSLMMRGYPLVAVVGYVLAAVAGMYLIVSTFIVDRKDQEKTKLK
jgi:predicted unusual protein kinase regulating ubiquinone biosynthesis (AarF/ABC1/UbiB family)